MVIQSLASNPCPRWNYMKGYWRTVMRHEIKQWIGSMGWGCQVCLEDFGSPNIIRCPGCGCPSMMARIVHTFLCLHMYISLRSNSEYSRDSWIESSIVVQPAKIMWWRSTLLFQLLSSVLMELFVASTCSSMRSHSISSFYVFIDLFCELEKQLYRVSPQIIATLYRANK